MRPVMVCFLRLFLDRFLSILETILQMHFVLGVGQFRFLFANYLAEICFELAITLYKHLHLLSPKFDVAFFQYMTVYITKLTSRHLDLSSNDNA